MVKELGKGAAAIFSGVSQPSEDESQILKDENQTMKAEKVKAEKRKADSQRSEVDIQKIKAISQNIDNMALEQAIEEGTKYPKVTVYSPVIAAVMRYKEITTPRFKLSPEVEARLEKVLRKEDPELWKAVENNIKWNRRKK